MDFQKLLLRVQESLSDDEVQDLLFLCSDLLSSKALSTVSSAGQLFSLLEKQDKLSSKDPSLLLELLKIMKRNSLIRSLGLEAHMQTNGTIHQQHISPYRQFLYALSESICNNDLRNIKFLLIETLPRRKLEKDLTLLQLFLEMEKEDLLGENKLDVLQDIIENINPCLEKRLIQYRAENCGGAFNAQETESVPTAPQSPATPSPLTSLPSYQSQQQDFSSRTETESSELPLMEQYEMKGDRRGVCLIINNYDFTACGLSNRKGTDIDKDSLEDVFQWLGFEVVTRRDCDRERILQILSEQAARDHTQADCFVCCVLSHGRVDGVVGVDGQYVTFQEMMDSLNPFQCSSLLQKPKLFFIQACRGNKEQRPAFPLTHSEDEAMVSDAAVPRNSIPEAADYLLAMSTVPYYVSFRVKDEGTWFIQSLCHNLRQLVPRGADLLSILTKVNNDVSKKSDKTGLRKQMPQPEFTLTKRVVFPPPANTRLPPVQQSEPQMVHFTGKPSGMLKSSTNG